MLTPYPPSLPIDACQGVIDYLRGRSTDKPLAMHAAWTLAGYALGQYAPNPQPMLRTPLSNVDLADALEEHIMGRGRLPWGLIFQGLLTLIGILL